MPTAEPINWITAAVLPGVSALLGGAVATTLALIRQRRERAFDRRLDWYERMHRTLMESRHSVLDAVHKAERDPTLIGDLQEKITESLVKIRDLRAACDVYASPPVYAAINDVFDSAKQQLDMAASSAAPIPPDQYLRLAKMQVNTFIRAAVLLAAEIRKHLQLEPLPDHKPVKTTK